jgi:ActR/RegA family two-component response regulator
MHNGKKALILSPNPSFSKEFRATLEKAGILSVTSAPNVEALKSAAVQLPCAVVVQLTLEDGWGFDLLSEVRAVFAGTSIFLTSEIMIINACAAQNLEAQAFFSLPAQTDELVKCLGEACPHDQQVPLLG